MTLVKISETTYKKTINSTATDCICSLPDIIRQIDILKAQIEGYQRNITDTQEILTALEAERDQAIALGIKTE